MFKLFLGGDKYVIYSFFIWKYSLIFLNSFNIIFIWKLLFSYEVLIVLIIKECLGGWMVVIKF